MAACAKGLHGQELADYLNGHQNFYKTDSRSAMRGAVMPQQVSSSELRSQFRASTILDYDDTPIPKEFDLRSQYPECADVIGHITNQGKCGDCWAHAATGVMSDRICIGSNGTQKAELSATELLSCCENCTKHPPEFGDADHKCSSGAPPISGYKYWVSDGVVTEQCQPVNSSLPFESDPPCPATCVDSEDFQAAKHYGAEAYYVRGERPVMAELIQREIMTNGSVSSTYRIYEDFMMYTSGIYIPASDKTKASHAVRIVGWGEERGIPYWLVANSWGPKRQENGYFRIIRGTNAAAFEEWIDTATPKL